MQTSLPTTLLYARDLMEKAWADERSAWKHLLNVWTPSAEDLEAWKKIKADAVRAQLRFETELHAYEMSISDR